MKIGSDRRDCKINKVQITDDTLSNRGGLSFILRCMDNTGLINMIENTFGYLRKSRKGETISEISRQFIAFCIDGTKHSIARFDELKKEPGYAAVFECEIKDLMSTATIKRFFKKFKGKTYTSFRTIVNDNFIWRLKQEKTKVINLHLDTMVLDNNDAQKRE